MKEKKGCIIKAAIGIYLVYIGIRLLIVVTQNNPSDRVFLSIFAVLLLGTGIICAIVSISSIFGHKVPDQKNEGKMRNALAHLFEKNKEKAKLRTGDTMEMEPIHLEEKNSVNVHRPEARELKPEDEEKNAKWQEVKSKRRKATIIELSSVGKSEKTVQADEEDTDNRRKRTAEKKEPEEKKLSGKKLPENDRNDYRTAKKEIEFSKKESEDQGMVNLSISVEAEGHLDTKNPDDKGDGLSIEIVEGGTKIYHFHSANETDQGRTSNEAETDFEEK